MSNVSSHQDIKGRRKKSMIRKKDDVKKTRTKPNINKKKKSNETSNVFESLPSINAQSVVINVHSNNSSNDRKNKVGIAFPDFASKLANFLK